MIIVFIITIKLLVCYSLILLIPSRGYFPDRFIVRERDPSKAIFKPKQFAHAQKVPPSAATCDDHFRISAFPFPFSVLSVSTCPIKLVVYKTQFQQMIESIVSLAYAVSWRYLTCRTS